MPLLLRNLQIWTIPFALFPAGPSALLEAQTHNECSSEPSYLALLHLQSGQEN